jgi:hypothetical protein
MVEDDGGQAIVLSVIFLTLGLNYFAGREVSEDSVAKQRKRKNEDNQPSLTAGCTQQQRGRVRLLLEA